MKKINQLLLFKKEPRFFGGMLLHGKRRSQRPLSTKEPIHIVLRSSWAKGPHSFLMLRNKNEIKRQIDRISRIYGVKVYRLAIVGNHLHLIIKIPSREAYKTFIRVLSSQIASHVMKAQSFKSFQTLLKKQYRGYPPKEHLEPQGKGQAFWQFRPWTRVLYWGNDFKECCKYVERNILEALGFIDYKPRINRYAKWMSIKDTG